MKKISIFCVLLMLLGLPAAAQESLSVGEVLVPQGRQAMIPVMFHFSEGHDYVSYQFTVNLPDGISSVTEANGKVPVLLGDGQDESLFTLDLDDTSPVLTCYSNPSTRIGGTEGVLVYLPVQASDELAVGTEVTCSLTGVAFASIDAVSHSFPNVSFTIRIQAPGIYFDEDDAVQPLYKDGDKDRVYMKRTIKAGRWSTIVLPFTLTKTKAEDIFGTDVQLAEFSGFETDYGDDEENVTPLGLNINFTNYTMTIRKGMTGGKPFLIKTSKDITEFNADDCTLVGAVADVTAGDADATPGKFTGSFVKTVVPEDGLFISNEKFWYSTGLTSIKAFRGWFELDAVLGRETNFEVKIFIDGTETSIGSPDVDSSASHNQGTYDLGGRKLQQPQHPGVYIINGQKVLVK